MGEHKAISKWKVGFCSQNGFETTQRRDDDESILLWRIHSDITKQQRITKTKGITHQSRTWSVTDESWYRVRGIKQQQKQNFHFWSLLFFRFASDKGQQPWYKAQWLPSSPGSLIGSWAFETNLGIKTSRYIINIDKHQDILWWIQCFEANFEINQFKNIVLYVLIGIRKTGEAT